MESMPSVPYLGVVFPFFGSLSLDRSHFDFLMNLKKTLTISLPSNLVLQLTDFSGLSYLVDDSLCTRLSVLELVFLLLFGTRSLLTSMSGLKVMEHRTISATMPVSIFSVKDMPLLSRTNDNAYGSAEIISNHIDHRCDRFCEYLSGWCTHYWL